MKNKYENILKTIQAVTETEPNLMANLANTVAILHAELGHYWTGVYLVDKSVNNLVLGPFQGPLACTRIPFGKGVCGSCWELEKSLIVDDVHSFKGHIACSSESNSEIVIPILKHGKVVAVLDIDSQDFNKFNEQDQFGLEAVSGYLSSLFEV